MNGKQSAARCRIGGPCIGRDRMAPCPARFLPLQFESFRAVKVECSGGSGIQTFAQVRSHCDGIVNNAVSVWCDSMVSSVLRRALGDTGFGVACNDFPNHLLHELCRFRRRGIGGAPVGSQEAVRQTLRISVVKHGVVR